MIRQGHNGNGQALRDAVENNDRRGITGVSERC